MSQMNFVISSTGFLSHLQAVGRVISNKNTLPILDNFLMQIKKKTLTITASDLESTFISTIALENVTGEGTIALDAKKLMDILKEFSEQPLTFNIDLTTYMVDILSEYGKFSIKGLSGEEFPQLPSVKEDKANSLKLGADVLQNGINKTLFATADDELRPVMNGIFFEITADDVAFVASDAHKLVRYKRTDVKPGINTSFILPKKPASLLKNVLSKETNDVMVQFDDKNAIFTLTHFKLICRLVEGNYPSYNSVIPTDNPNKLIIDRVEFFNTCKRVSVFSNEASNLIRLQLSPNQLTVSAQDIDYSLSGHERVNCNYDGEEMEIGFKSAFLIEILQNLPSTEVLLEMSDPTRAGLLSPHEADTEGEDILMLLMPMMVNA